MLELIRRRRLRERYALLWLATGVVLLVLSLWRGGLNTIAGWLGVTRLSAGGAVRGRGALHPARAAALLDGDLELADQNMVLAQRLALLEQRLREATRD